MERTAEEDTTLPPWGEDCYWEVRRRREFKWEECGRRAVAWRKVDGVDGVDIPVCALHAVGDDDAPPTEGA